MTDTTDNVASSEIIGNDGSDAQQQNGDRGDGRTVRGQFVPQTGQQGHDGGHTQEDPQAPPEGMIPIQALDARLAKQEEKWSGRYTALENQFTQFRNFVQSVQQPRQPPPPQRRPEFFEDPDAAIDHRLEERLSPLAQQQQGIVENFSRMMAEDKFGGETVDAALTELEARVNANPRAMAMTYRQIMSAPHPYGALVKWHKEQSALSKYGDDPEAAINAEVERRMAALQQQNGGGQQQTPASPGQQPRMPASFAGGRNNGPRSSAAFSGPKPLSEIMGGR